MASRLVRSNAVTVGDVLDGHTLLEIDCVDRVYLTLSVPNLVVGGNVMWTLRATARLRAPDGQATPILRTAAATVKLLDRKRFAMPLHVLRWYEDAWTQFAVTPPALPGPPPGLANFGGLGVAH